MPITKYSIIVVCAGTNYSSIVTCTHNSNTCTHTNSLAVLTQLSVHVALILLLQCVLNM